MARLAVGAVGLHRGITLTGVLAAGAGITTTSMAVAFVAVAVWGCALVGDAWRRGAFRRRLAAVDVALAVAVGLLALTWGAPGMRFSYGILQGAAVVAGYALPAQAATVAVSTLVFVDSLATLVPPGSTSVTLPEFAAYAATLVVLALAAAAADAAAIGLRVHPLCDALPPDLDPAVVTAIAMAVREALNNVHRHAHTGQVWLSAAEEDGRVVVRVVDRGTGFAPAQSVAGSGIRDSVSARMWGGRRCRTGRVHPWRGDLCRAEVAAMIGLAAIDDDRMLLSGLAAWLADATDLHLVTITDTVDRLLRHGTHGIDVVLLDLLLADRSDPADNIHRLTAAGPRILVVSVVADPSQIIAAHTAGAAGYLTKVCSGLLGRRACGKIESVARRRRPFLAQVRPYQSLTLGAALRGCAL